MACHSGHALVPGAAPHSFRAANALVGGAIAALGNTRPTRPLLVRDDMGRPRATTFNLPDENFVYGRPGNQDLEGAREVCMHWASHVPSKGPEVNVPDFVDLNRRAAASKVTTAKDLKHYRQEQDVLATPRVSNASPRRRSPGRAIIPSDVVPGFTYGKKVRPSTPIHEVISARFAERAERQLDHFYAEMRAARDAAQTQVRKIPFTVASRGHASAAKKAMTHHEEAKELFKLTKFKRVGAKVDTNSCNTPRRPRLLHGEEADPLADANASAVVSDQALDRLEGVAVPS